MILKQQPSSRRGRGRSSKKGLRLGARKTSWLDAKLDAVSSDAFRFSLFMIASGLAALVWVGFVGTALLRQTATPPEKVATQPPPLLASAPAAADSTNSPGQTIESSEPTPLNFDAPQDASDAAVAPPVSTATPAPGNVPLPAVRKATAPKPVATPTPPPAKPITVIVRTFHPPVISSSFKDMVADKMKELGISPRLEAKVRSGQQLTKEDLASIPKSVMEKINNQAIAYGQPPLYTDATTTIAASVSR